MKFKETPIQGIFIVELEPHTDERGWFARAFCKKEFREIGFRDEFVQINHSYNRSKGTFRGFHYQAPPNQEAKLIRCVSGAALDYAIDIRKNSPTFLKFVEVELSEENKRMILIPGGCAHGFVTLTDHVSLIYHHTQYYDKESEKGIRHDDPRLGISLDVEKISERDRSYSYLQNDFCGIEVT